MLINKKECVSEAKIKATYCFFLIKQRICRRMSDDVVFDLEHEQEI